VDTPPARGGQECPGLTESEECGTTTCPVDCRVSQWSPWTACSATCGRGRRHRGRAVDTPPARGGQECPGLTESEECGTTTCPVDCRVSQWSPWTTCSATCGGGRRSRGRTVDVQSAGGGRECPGLTELEECGTAPCSVDCRVSQWSPWTTCSATCGGGGRHRERAVDTPPTRGGQECPGLLEVEVCSTELCSVDCRLSQWGSWSTCTATCGGGRRSREREVDVLSARGGIECPGLTESEECGTTTCPVDCRVSQWTSWSTCSATCGGGRRSRSRRVTRQPVHGQECPGLAEKEACGTRRCPCHGFHCGASGL